MESFVGVSRPNKRPLEEDSSACIEKRDVEPFVRLNMPPITSYFRDIDFDCNQHLMVTNLDSILFYKSKMQNNQPKFVFERMFPTVSSSIDVMKYDNATESLVLLSKKFKNVDIYDLYGGIIHTFNIGSTSTPVDLAINQSNGNIFISEFIAGRVIEFGNDGTFKKVLSSEFRPYGLSVNHELGYVLVSDTLNKRVAAYSINEKKLLFRFGSEVFRCPESIVWDKSYNIYVGDAVTKCVNVFDKTGKFIEVIPHLTPGSLAISEENDLFVSDYKKEAIVGFHL